MSCTCANCGIEIRWQPTVVDGKPYCCVGCSHGGPCTCDYDHLPGLEGYASLSVRTVQITISESRRIMRRPSEPPLLDEVH